MDTPIAEKPTLWRVEPSPLPVAEEMDGPAELLFANPPAPDGDTWIRCQHRQAQRAPEGTVWPQTALAQLAALFPERRVALIDAIAERLTWAAFAARVRRAQPRWLVVLLGGPTLAADLRAVALGKDLGAHTVGFGPLAGALGSELLRRAPQLDYAVCGEPEVTLRELVDTVDERHASRPAALQHLCASTTDVPPLSLGAIAGLAWRCLGEPVVNVPRPLIPHLDDLPLPLHHLLPLRRYAGPGAAAPVAMVVTSRGCPGQCTFCLKHASYRSSLRLRSAESIVQEMALLRALGVRHVHLQADLFTACRDQVEAICRLLVLEGNPLTWSCGARVDTVDADLLRWMSRAGCRQVTWAIEAGNERLLWQAGKGTRIAQVVQALDAAQAAHIRSWGSFRLGLPGETERTLGQTIDLAMALPLERATFELATPVPGTPLWEQATAHGWLRTGLAWENAEPGGPAALDYPGLPAATLEAWLARAYRDWAFRPGSRWERLGRLASNQSLGEPSWAHAQAS